MAESKIIQAVPLMQDDEGVFRIVGSRVTLDSIVHQFKSGATAEQIQEDFPSLVLSDVYSVIAYYLQQTREVEDYLDRQTQACREVQGEVEGALETRELRERLRRRRARPTA